MSHPLLKQRKMHTNASPQSGRPHNEATPLTLITGECFLCSTLVSVTVLVRRNPICCIERPRLIETWRNVCLKTRTFIVCSSFSQASCFQLVSSSLNLNSITATFGTYFPGLYHLYDAQIGKAFANLEDCQPVVPDSVFPALTFNFGRVCCFMHKDVLNYSLGQCAITSLGDFDHTQGGHIIFEELKLVIKFPSASTIFIPSASITHGNIPVSVSERRISMTQWAAGAIFQWVDNGFKTDGQLSKEELIVAKSRRRLLWEQGLEMLPHISHFTSAKCV